MKTWLIPVAVAAFAGSAWAQDPVVGVFDLSAIDPDVPPSMNKQLSDAMRAELAKSLALVPAKAIDDVRTGFEAVPDVKAPKALIDEGKALARKGQFKPAMLKYAEAGKLLTNMLEQLRDYTPLEDMLLNHAVAAQNARDIKTADAMFGELARVRPDYKIDPAQYPPAVQAAFDKAKALQAKQARGRINVTSNPTGARIYVDEIAQGTAPTALVLSPGEHVLRLSSPGYFSFTETVEIASYQKTDKPVSLIKNRGMQAISQLEAEAAAANPPEALFKVGAQAAGVLKAAGVVVGASARSVGGYAVSLGYFPKQGSPYFVVGEVKRDLSDLATVSAELAKVIGEAARGKAELGAPGKPVIRKLEPLTTRPLDFDKFNLGFAAGPLPPELLVPQIPEGFAGAQQPAPAVEKKSSTWWIWTLAAVVVVGAAGGGTAYYLMNQQTPSPQFNLQKQ